MLDVYFLAGANDFLVHVADPEHRRAAPVRRPTTSTAIPAIAGTETNLIFEHARAAGRGATADTVSR